MNQVNDSCCFQIAGGRVLERVFSWAGREKGQRLDLYIFIFIYLWLSTVDIETETGSLQLASILGVF